MRYLYLCAVLCAAMSLTGVFDDGAETSENNRDFISPAKIRPGPEALLRNGYMGRGSPLLLNESSSSFTKPGRCKRPRAQLWPETGPKPTRAKIYILVS